MVHEVQSTDQPRLLGSKKLARYSWRIKTLGRKLTLNRSALTSKRLITDEAQIGANEIIVSLTTYGRRLKDVHLVVESISQQTFRPSRLILWLDEVECGKMTLPVELQRQEERGLEINFCPNLGPYKKLIPTLQICPDATIVTIDDDVLYPKDMLEKLVAESVDFPGTVIANRARRMKIGEGILAPYSEWDYVLTEESPSSFTVPIGIGGVLYPPHVFHSDVCLDMQFMDLAPNADDVWFKAMSLLNGVKSKKTADTRVFYSRFLEIPGSQTSALHYTNLHGQENDKQIASVFEAYEVYDLVRATRTPRTLIQNDLSRE